MESVIPFADVTRDQGIGKRNGLVMRLNPAPAVRLIVAFPPVSSTAVETDRLPRTQSPRWRSQKAFPVKALNRLSPVFSRT